MRRTGIGIGLLVAAAVVVIVVAYINIGGPHAAPPVFSSNAELDALWHQYKGEFLEPGTGRTLDKQQDNITTSEGESYTMLRAVWEDDHATFDQSLTWLNNNLKHQHDALFAWKFGRLPNGSYGIITDQGGQNSASDADTNIALALIMAAERWQQQSYLTEAKSVVGSIWSQEVVSVGVQPVMVADNLERNNPSQVIINPSYWSPAAFRLFAKVDRSHNWTQLANHSIELIDQLSGSTLGGQKGVGLPPDWAAIDLQTGAITAPPSGLTTDYGFNAMRVPFQLALDYRWNHTTSALLALQQMYWLQQQWRLHQQLAAVYGHDGTVKANYESAAVYGGDFGYFLVADSADASAVANQKLQALYNKDKQSFTTDLGYYDANWAWFAIALNDNILQNVAGQNL